MSKSPSTNSSSSSNLAAVWRSAIVAEPMGFADEALNTVGAFTLSSGQPTILSLDPAADFELNTDIIHQWKIVFQTSQLEVVGDTDYQRALSELQPFVLDQQNGSLLLRALTDDELLDLHAQTIFD